MLVMRFKVPVKASHTSRLMEAYSQTLCTEVGRKVDDLNG